MLLKWSPIVNAVKPLTWLKTQREKGESCGVSQGEVFL
jgi:hypothetical protein